MTEYTVQGFIKELVSPRPGGTMTHLEWLRRPPRRRSMKTLLELFEKYEWLEERIGRGLPIPISRERQQVYARRLRRRRSAQIAGLPAFRQELEAMCFAAICLGTLVDDMLRLVEIRITSIWNWGHKVVAERLVPARVGVTATMEEKHPLAATEALNAKFPTEKNPLKIRHVIFSRVLFLQESAYPLNAGIQASTPRKRGVSLHSTPPTFSWSPYKESFLHGTPRGRPTQLARVALSPSPNHSLIFALIRCASSGRPMARYRSRRV
jgi:hypothetical protein